MAEPERLSCAPVCGSSVLFALGAPTNDAEVRSATAWVRGIVGRFPPSGDALPVFGDTATSLSALNNQILRVRWTGPLELPGSGADSPARGLEGHTLVLLMRTLPSEGLLVSGHWGFGQLDAVLSAASLDAVKGLQQAPFEGKRFDTLLWILLLVLAFKNVIVLPLDGLGGSAEPFARKLHELTNRSVFFNTDPLQFEPQRDAAGAPRFDPTTKLPLLQEVRVGAAGTQGTSFFDGSQVELKAGPSEFLPGAQLHLPPVTR